jgi:hypothetical protein
MAGLPDMHELSPLPAESAKQIAVVFCPKKKHEPPRIRRFMKETHH